MQKILYQLSTHWDREWYLPFQGFRFQLVDFFDQLILDLESDTIPQFVFDGQTIILEDYLNVRPENKARITSLISQKKLLVGPWYVMPDEFLVSGESLIENLLVGQNIAHSFDCEPWKFGYVCDIFGHTPQLPQIFNGFGIDGAFIGRGISSLPDGSDFLWRSPDGSECITRKDCYGAFRASFCDADDKSEALRQKVGDAPLTLLNFTGDHAAVDAAVKAFLQCLDNSKYEVFNDFTLLSSLVNKKQLPVVTGELIEPAHEPDDFRVVNGSVSSYYPLKHQNDITEHRVFSELAPLIVMGELTETFKNKHPFYQLARKYLLQNHPHDSICGCSVDLVHMDMPYRFRQALNICDAIRDKFCEELEHDKNSFALTIINTDIHAVDDVITLSVDFPRDWKDIYTDNTGYQSFNLFDIVDSFGNILDYQILNIERNHESYIVQKEVYSDRYTLAVKAKLPAFGYAVFNIIPRKKRKALPPATPLVCFAENEYLKLTVEHDGSISITDKLTGRSFNGLHEFVDDADSGNGWFHEPAAFDEPVISSRCCQTHIEKIHSGSLVNTIRITKIMDVPCSLDIHNKRRCDEYIQMRITSLVTLRKGQKFVEFSTTVENAASEHRLRVMFPTCIEGDSYFASQAFCFVKRNRGSSLNGYCGRETEYTEKCTSGIVGTGDFAFVGSKGIHEAGVYPDGTISAVLFRSVGKMFHQPHSNTAKLLETMNFHYAIAIGCSASKLMSIQNLLYNDFPVIFRNLKTSKSLISISNDDVLLSTIKPSEAGNDFIIRLYNPTDTPATCTLEYDKSILDSLFFVSLSENDKKALENTFTIRPFEIYTVLATRKQ